ncbi:unnamed protein product, partial [Oncorhynchus mykiss]
EEEREGGEVREAMTEEHRSVSEEASDSCRTDSRFMTSISSDSLDALEEDDLIACSSSLPHPHPPFRLTVEPPHPQPHPREGASSPQGGAGEWRGEGGGGGRSNEGTGQEVFSVSGCPRSSSSSLMDCVFTFEQSDARHYYNICPNVTPDSTRSLTHPHPETEEEEGGGEEEEQGGLLTLEPVPILQPPPGFGDSSSDEEFFDARDRIASPEDPTSGTVLSDIRISLAEGTRHEREEEGREGETSEGGGGRDMFSRLSRKRSKKRRSFMQTDFTSTVSYPGPDENQERNRNPDHNRRESSDESQQLSLDPEPSEQSQNPCPTVSSLSHAEGEASQLESKPILAKPSPEGSHRGPGEPCGDLHRSSRNRRQSMETEPDMMESKSVTALVTAASLSITAVRCRVEPDGKESPDRRGDGEEVEGEEGEIDNDEAIDSTNSVTDNTDVATANIAATGNIHSVMANTETTVDSDLAIANHKDTNSIKSVPANTIAYADFAMTNNEANAIINSLTTSNDSTTNANSAMANIPKESPISPTTGFLLRPCSPGIIGQSLSASTLRGKIQSLPLYLSRSQETLTLSGVGSPIRSPSPETTSNKTEVMVTTETTKYDDVTKVATGEDLKDSGVALVESDDSEVTLTESEVGEVVVETAGAEITRLTSKPDPKMVVKLPTCPIATVETAPPMAPAPICLEPKPVPELLSPGSTIHKMATPLPSCPSFPVPIRVEPKPDHEPLSIRSKMAAFSVLASGCETVLEGVQTPLEACRCPPPLVYTNCFSGVLLPDKFSSRLPTSSSALALPLTTSPPLSSFLSSSPPSSLLSPSFPRSSSLHDDISRLRHRRFPPPPAGRGGRHPRETCATHFSENKRLLHGEARRLMAGCQKVVRVGQTPDEMLFSLSDSFRTLVGMAGMCLWFSGCDRCDRRNAEALAGLADVARTYREFVLAAERASGRRSCHDLSTKLLAKQCTALTASVFCLTQLFRTLTAL